MILICDFHIMLLFYLMICFSFYVEVGAAAAVYMEVNPLRQHVICHKVSRDYFNVSVFYFILFFIVDSFFL